MAPPTQEVKNTNILILNNDVWQMSEIPGVVTILGEDAFFHKCLLHLACIFTLNFGTCKVSHLW